MSIGSVTSATSATAALTSAAAKKAASTTVAADARDKDKDGVVSAEEAQAYAIDHPDYAKAANQAEKTAASTETSTASVTKNLLDISV